MEPFSIACGVLALLNTVHKLITSTCTLVSNARAVDDSINIDLTHITFLSSLVHSLDKYFREAQPESQDMDWKIIARILGDLKSTLEQLSAILGGIISRGSIIRLIRKHDNASKIAYLRELLVIQSQSITMFLSAITAYIPSSYPSVLT